MAPSSFGSSSVCANTSSNPTPPSLLGAPVVELRVDRIGAAALPLAILQVAFGLWVHQRPRDRQTELAPVLQTAVDVVDPVPEIGARFAAACRPERGREMQQCGIRGGLGVCDSLEQRLERLDDALGQGAQLVEQRLHVEALLAADHLLDGSEDAVDDAGEGLLETRCRRGQHGLERDQPLAQLEERVDDHASRLTFLGDLQERRRIRAGAAQDEGVEIAPHFPDLSGPYRGHGQGVGQLLVMIDELRLERFRKRVGIQ